MSDRSIRRAPAGIALLIGALLLGACAAPDNGPTDPAPTSTTAPAESSLMPAAEGTTTYPLTLESTFGSTELTARPERIAVVTASTADTDALLALGVTPVFAPTTLERNPWLDAAEVEAIEKLWESESGAEVSAEAVAAARPDLIISLAAYETFDQARFDQLSQIAPVLHAPAGELSWQEITLALGEPLDLAAAAEASVEQAETAIADLREAHPEFEGNTAAHVIVYEERWGTAYVSAPGSDTAALFEALGFTLPPAADQFIDDDLVSLELAGLIDADFLLISTFPGSEYFLDSPVVQAVPAVADSRAVINPADEENGINYFAWGLNVPSVVSVPWLLDQLADFGSEALS